MVFSFTLLMNLDSLPFVTRIGSHDLDDRKSTVAFASTLAPTLSLGQVASIKLSLGLAQRQNIEEWSQLWQNLYGFNRYF